MGPYEGAASPTALVHAMCSIFRAPASLLGRFLGRPSGGSHAEPEGLDWRVEAVLPEVVVDPVLVGQGRAAQDDLLVPLAEARAQGLHALAPLGTGPGLGSRELLEAALPLHGGLKKLLVRPRGRGFCHAPFPSILLQLFPFY